MLGTLIRQERLRQGISQEALCHGICSASYLSKIENDAVECSNEIYEKLFAQLKINYIADEELVAALDREYERVFSVLHSEGYFYVENTGIAVSQLCKKMRYSPRHIEASLLYALNIFFETGEADACLLDFSPSVLSEGAKELQALTRALHLSKKRCFSEAMATIQSIGASSEPWTTQAIGLYCYKMGHYGRAEEKLRLAYSAFAEGGYIHAMLDTALLLAATGSGSADIASMHRWAQIARRINSVVGNQRAEVTLSYNLGATCLMLGNVERGLKYLEECRKAAEYITGTSPIVLSMLYQKLAFACVLMRKTEAAKDYLSRIDEDELQGHLHSFSSVIRYILVHPDWQADPLCCEMLERCYIEASENEDIGFARFYVFYLLESYKAQRKYKNACVLLEQTSFINNGIYPD